MPSDRHTALAEIVAATGLVLAAAAILVDSLSLPPPRFDLLGSAFVPRSIAFAIAALALAVLAGALLRLRRAPAAPAPDEEAATHRRRPDLALATFGASLLYVAVLSSRLVNYGLATAVFILAVSLTLAGVSRRTVLVAGILAVLLGFGGDTLFTRIFFIDLP